jgi:deoxyribonuclease-4
MEGTSMILGSHVSIRNGYLYAAETAWALGATAFQYFPKNPKSIGVKNFNVDDVKHCSEFCRHHNITSIAHTPYPTKLIPENKELEKQIIQSIRKKFN